MNIRVLILLALLVCGCTLAKKGHTYDVVDVHYAVVGGQKVSGYHSVEYLIKNNNVRYIAKDGEGAIVKNKSGQISDAAYKALGKTIVETGFFGLQGNLTRPNYGDPDPAVGVFSVRIDDEDHVVRIEPYDEQYQSGNINKIVFMIKRLTQGLQ